MIDIRHFHEMLLQMQAEVNEQLQPGFWTQAKSLWIDGGQLMPDATWEKAPVVGKRIDHIFLSATEAHLTKKISDKSGIVLAVKMPDADSEIRTADDYSENNHCLFFLIEKVNPGSMDDSIERGHYAKIQRIMTLIKDWILAHGLNGSLDDGGETLSKSIRTEWEYQVYGGFNGMSIGFDLRDFSL